MNTSEYPLFGAVLAMILFLAAAALTAPTPAAGQSAAAQAAQAAPAGPERQGAAADTGDVLRPGDVVRLAVWREESFSGEFVVDRDGQVVLPRLGVLEVTGVPTAELRERILTGLARYLRNPSIEVAFLRRVAIHGAVTNAGLYPVDPTMTVLDALALAGGARPDGRLDQIRLIRNGVEVATVPTTGVQLEELRIRSGDQLFVPEQTWLRRNSSLVVTGISSVASLVIAILYLSR